MKPGERYRVKSTPILRRYGVRTGGSWQAKGDDRAWPGDVGIVVERRWTAHDGSTCSDLRLEFDRGRSVDAVTADLADFVRVRFPLDAAKRNR